MIPTSRLQDIVEQHERGIGDDERAELARDLLAARRLLTRVNLSVGTIMMVNVGKPALSELVSRELYNINIMTFKHLSEGESDGGD